MSTDTRPPGAAALEATTRSVWSSRDEATLQELAARKQRIMGAHRETLVSVLAEAIRTVDAEQYADEVIAIAESLRDAMAPFDSRTK